MDEFHFLRPLWLLLLIPMLALWWGLWRRQDRMSSWRQIIDAHLIEHLVVGSTARRGLRPIHILPIIWLIGAFALAGPSWRLAPSSFADDQAGLVVLLKVSATMSATDIQPSRLDRAKHKLSDLLELRQGAATGLIVYSGSAHLVMPLTRDDRIISAMVEDITPELMPVDGDNLTQALQLARRMLDMSGRPGSVLVIADSVSPQQRLSAAAEGLSVQFLSVLPTTTAVDRGLQSAATELGAEVVRLTTDPSDVERLGRRAKSGIEMVSVTGHDPRWQDAGYTLLPFLALFALLWSRRGWLLT